MTNKKTQNLASLQKKRREKMKRVITSIIVVLMISAAASALTNYYQWTGLAGDGDWNNPNNWSPNPGFIILAQDSGGIMGNPNIKVGFKTPGNYPTLVSNTYSADILVCGGANASYQNELVLNGSTLNISEYITLAAATNDTGVMTINSGTLNTGVQYSNAAFYVTQKGTGILHMNGGTLNVGLNYSGNLNITSADTTGAGTLYLDGGTIYANDLVKGSGTASLVVTLGRIILNGDRTNEIQGYIDEGWLTAAPGFFIPVMHDDLADVTIIGIPEPATIGLLALGGLLLRKRKI
jgi:hypothetical protein